MVEAFTYMYFVALAGSLGVATTIFISWKVYKRSNKKTIKNRGIV